MRCPHTLAPLLAPACALHFRRSRPRSLLHKDEEEEEDGEEAAPCPVAGPLPPPFKQQFKQSSSCVYVVDPAPSSAAGQEESGQ